jgi:hypothetical protein
MRTLSVILALSAALPAGAQAPKEMKNPPRMTVKVASRDEPDKKDPKKILRKLTGSGDAEYPDGAALQFGVRLKEDQNFVMKAQGFVTGGKWEIELPGLGNDIYHGLYVCQVEFDPELQAPGIVPKLAADKRGRNSASTEHKIGTDEEIAAERKEVLEWYKGTLARAREKFDAVNKEYEAQKAAPNRESWNKFVGAISEQLGQMDLELAQWRKRRLNVMLHGILDAISTATLSLKEFALENYTAGIPFDGRKPPPGAGPEQNQEAIRAMLDKADKDIAAALTGGSEGPKK